MTLHPKKNHGKPQLGDHLLKAVRPVITSDTVVFPHMTSVGSLSRSGRENEGKK